MGPKTFDIEGVDSFPQDEVITINHKGSKVDIVSKGSSNYRKSVDDHVDESKLVKDENGNYTSNKIYGPRIKSSGKLYSQHFSNKYDELIDSKHFGTDGEKTKNIIDIYWDKYNSGWKDKDGKKLERKNKKKKKILSPEFIEDDDDDDDVISEFIEDDEDLDDRTINIIEFTDINGNNYKLDTNGVVYDEKNNKIYDNILDEQVNKIIKDAAEEYNLIKKISENTYILDLESDDLETTKEIIYLNEKNSEYYLFNKETGIVNRLNLSEDNYEIDKSVKYNSFEEFLSDLSITIKDLQEIEIEEDTEDEYTPVDIDLPINPTKTTEQLLIEDIDSQQSSVDLSDIKTAKSEVSIESDLSKTTPSVDRDVETIQIEQEEPNEPNLPSQDIQEGIDAGDVETIQIEQEEPTSPVVTAKSDESLDDPTPNEPNLPSQDIQEGIDAGDVETIQIEQEEPTSPVVTAKSDESLDDPTPNEPNLPSQDIQEGIDAGDVETIQIEQEEPTSPVVTAKSDESLDDPTPNEPNLPSQDIQEGIDAGDVETIQIEQEEPTSPVVTAKSDESLDDPTPNEPNLPSQDIQEGIDAGDVETIQIEQEEPTSPVVTAKSDESLDDPTPNEPNLPSQDIQEGIDAGDVETIQIEQEEPTKLDLSSEDIESGDESDIESGDESDIESETESNTEFDFDTALNEL